VLGRWPALRVWESSLLVAVNLRYAVAGDPVPPGAEVAIMPPVQGG
jgi:molybdopterin converting factor small subunit